MGKKYHTHIIYNYGMNRFEAKTYQIANARYLQGYTVALSWLSEYLDVSVRWLKDNILKYVNYTVYSLSGSDYIRWTKEGRNNGTFVDLDEINNFIIKKYREGEYFFEAQTEVIDLYSYLEGKSSKRNEALKIYKNSFSSFNTGYGRLPKKLIEYIDKHYLKGRLENVSVRTLYRKDEYGEKYIADGRNSGRYPWVKTDPVNIFGRNIFLYFPKRDLIIDNVTVKAGEHIHRYAFMHGHIRLCMGKSADGRYGNKVIYIGKKDDQAKDFKIPYTIPYGKSINRF